MKPLFDAAAYQERIDQAIGTANGRPLIKLGWAPHELRWTPYRLGTNPPGYTYPIFCAGKDAAGKFIAPERWELTERIEPAQYESDWEGKRYVNWRGSIWDVKGPCPHEKYVALRVHAYHDGICCPCLGSSCACGEDRPHCWGNYAEPNEDLLNWICRTASEARQDSDVKPDEDIRNFSAPNAQRELISETEKSDQQFDQIAEEAARHINDTFLRQPHSVTSRIAPLTPEEQRRGEEAMKAGRSSSETVQKYADYRCRIQQAYDAEHPITRSTGAQRTS